MPIDVEWPDGRVSRLRIDIEAATLTFSSLLEAGAGSALYRELKALARAAQSPGRDPARVDPARAMLRVTEQAGAVSWSITVTRGEYEYCTRHLIELAREALAWRWSRCRLPKTISRRSQTDNGRYSDRRDRHKFQSGLTRRR